MPLIDDVKQVLNDLAPHGWQELFAAHGLDITANNLENELLTKKLIIDRSIDGFKDFSKPVTHGITAGIPSESLVYHALASPAVIHGISGVSLSKFPSIKQIETIENYVYASAKRSIDDIFALFPNDSEFAIAVFSLEYRNLPNTVHKRSADLCFSRTGVARVGNTQELYIPKERGFVSHEENDNAHTFRTVPVRYAAFISLLQKGNTKDFGPARFDLGISTGQSQQSDAENDFWVPIHKLFDGTECLIGENLKLDISHYHVNEKLKRIHLEKMGVQGFNTGHNGSDLESWPFKFSNDICSFSTSSDESNFLLKPVPHPLIEPAIERSSRFTTLVPPKSNNFFSPSFTINSDGDFRRAPEYVHVREKVQGSSTQNLNDQMFVEQQVNKGNYRAQHYLDYAADGWVKAECKEISHKIIQCIPAYSIIAAPDFFPNVSQGELMDWWLRLPRSFQMIWRVPPFSLSDQRTAANLTFIKGNLTGLDKVFHPDDITGTALVSQHKSINSPSIQNSAKVESRKTKRQSVLPDAAAGIFAPGWDTSLDEIDGTAYLSAYGLGSPFPEDAKLCAAISTFWPAAAPDSSRQYAPSLLSQSTEKAYSTVCPLTDEEIGLGNSLSWDGNVGPKIVVRGTTEVVEYSRFEYVDYIINSISNKISMARTGKISFDDYTNRILGMNRVYQALNIENEPNEKRKWGIISFSEINDTNPIAQSAITNGINISGRILKFEMFKSNGRLDHPTDFKKIHVEINRRLIALYDGLSQIHLFESNQWVTKQVN